jgi:hypothetical protein
MAAATPFYDPQGVLIDWKDGPGWTLADALAGSLTTGSTGSGKSSGPGAMQRRAFLRSTAALPGGMGGIVFFAKNGEADEWAEVCQRLGRGQDVIRVAAGGRYRFNFLDWIAGWGEGGERGPIPAVALLEEIASAVDPAGGSSGGDGAGKGENAFFHGAHRSKLTNLVHLCQLAGLPVSLPLMRAISSSAPQTLAQSRDLQWQEGSVCWHMLREGEAATMSDAAARADFEECRRYFLRDYPALSDRTRGVVEIMFTGLVRPFLTRPLRPLFCEETTVRPEMCFDGAIILVDIPVQEYGLTARMAAIAWKRAFQLAVMRRSGAPGSLRPVFMFADEAQNFLSPRDTEYQAVARGAGGVTCLLTQQLSSIREAIGSQDKAENLTANLQTKWFCQNTGETNQWASRLIGERYVSITAVNVGRGGGVQSTGVLGEASTHASVNRSEQKRAFIEPSAFQTLRRGGGANNHVVDAVVFCGGKLFGLDKDPQPFKILSFPQKG